MHIFLVSQMFFGISLYLKGVFRLEKLHEMKKKVTFVH